MSRTTLDTNILRIRDVFALNRDNGDFIQPGEIPIIGINGQLQWYSSIQFLSSISIPSTNGSVLDILNSVQELSTSLQSSFTSTTAGLGSSGYVSTSYLHNELIQLAQVYKYISGTTLYDCIANLGNLRTIGDNLGTMSVLAPGSNFAPYGYVSTTNPGEYRVYKSSIGLEGSNLTNYNLVNNTGVNSANIRIAGFSNHIVNSSKMTIDVMTNMNILFSGDLAPISYFSTYVADAQTDQQRGDPMKITFPSGTSNVNLANFRCILNSNHLTPFPEVLELRHILSNTALKTTTLNTYIPEINGIFVTLDNTD